MSLPPSLNLRVPADECRSHGAPDVHTTGAGAWQHGCLATATSSLPATAAAAAAAATAATAAAAVGVTQQLGVSALFLHSTKS